ncbi:MAG: [FeFe] hydrogenase H-cluster radical SAM maturase HydE [Planctomycetota bacterium]
MNELEIINWLREDDPQRLEQLWEQADAVRREHVGDEVHLRGLIEISNRCVRRCAYCGLSVVGSQPRRYRMTPEEILDCARKAVLFGYGTVVIQAGEDPALDAEFISDIVRRIRRETPLAITLSLGERTTDELARWREDGADRYLLRFETSDRALYDRIHPPVPDRRSDRFADLRNLRRLGYEVGSGVMVGIPGQTYDSLASDIQAFAELDLDMIGVGPFIAHPGTPLGRNELISPAGGGQQVPATEAMTYKVIALARLVCPRANIPSTSALATLNLQTGRELGLERGANVVMPNLTPVEYREHYEIYPAKACIRETGEQCHRCMRGRIAAIGRTPGTGRGDSPNYHQRHDSYTS